jgi:hypothetical protein
MLIPGTGARLHLVTFCWGAVDLAGSLSVRWSFYGGYGSRILTVQELKAKNCWTGLGARAKARASSKHFSISADHSTLIF